MTRERAMTVFDRALQAGLRAELAGGGDAGHYTVTLLEHRLDPQRATRLLNLVSELGVELWLADGARWQLVDLERPAMPNARAGRRAA